MRKSFLFCDRNFDQWIISVANFGQDWESGEIITKTQYVAGSSQEINASIGVHVGLRSVNVTLKQIRRENSHIDLPKNEEIDYNERFSWTWDQGRFGFGPQGELKFHKNFLLPRWGVIFDKTGRKF